MFCVHVPDNLHTQSHAKWMCIIVCVYGPANTPIHMCVICPSRIIVHHLSMPSNGHMIAEKFSQMLKSYLPCASKMHICDKSMPPSASRPLVCFFFFFFSSHFFSQHWKISIDWLCRSYCDRFVLGEVPDFFAINHSSKDIDIHTWSTAGSLAARFLSSE